MVSFSIYVAQRLHFIGVDDGSYKPETLQAVFEYHCWPVISGRVHILSTGQQ
jgi:hypothetical protein